MKLADCVEYLSRGKSPNYVDRSEITVINQACIYWDGINSSKVKYHNPNSAYEKAVLQNGDVLINSTGTGTLGRAAVYYNFGEITIADSHVTIIRTDKNKVLPEFLCLYLRHESTQKEIYSKCVSGSTNQIELSKEKLLSFPMPEIPVKVQNDIVKRLGKISRIITIRNKELSTLDDLIKARFVEMFGDPETNPKGWEQVTLGDVCSSIVRGPFGSALKKEFFVEPDDTTYKVYEQKHAIQKSAVIGSYYVTAEKYKELRRFECVAGDIIMSCSGTMGELYQLPEGCERGIINQALCKFTLNERILPVCFLTYMRQTIGNLETKGSGIQNIAAVSYVKAMPINLPPMNVQQQFATFVAQIDKSKSVIRKSLDETQRLFDSLMQQYFG